MLQRPSLDDLRAARPDLSLAVYAMDPGQGVTLEIHHDGHVYTFKGETVADAILAAFPPPPEEQPATPDSIFD
jgi:hypothetical protein